MEIHFVYAGQPQSSKNLYYRLGPIILEGMKKYKIRLVMVTIIYLQRWKLITKEKMESYCLGKEDQKKSINDDLESFFENLQHGEPIPYSVEHNDLYFLPKLTREELKLVERKDSNYMKTFIHWDPDVNEAEMKLSESNAKYLLAKSARKTIRIMNNKRRNPFRNRRSPSRFRDFLMK